MPRRQKRNPGAPVGTAQHPLKLHHTSRHKKAKRSLPRLELSSSIYTDGPTPKTSSPKRGGGHASSSTSNDDDADGDISNADGAEPDDESDEDEESDAFAPSDRAIEKHADQAGHVNGDVPHHGSHSDRRPSDTSTAFQDETGVVKESTTVGDSDDDVYRRVDQISDSEEDEPKVEHMEERNIIESEETNGLNNVPASFEASDGWEGLELDDGLFEDYPFFDEQYGRTDSNILDDELELFQSANIIDEAPLPSPSSSSPRRVRFKDPFSQSSTDSDMDSDSRYINVLFSPDATPTVPSGGNLDSSGPWLDHEGDNGSPVGNSSGYEIDYGDYTTEEEEVPPSAIKRPKSLRRQPPLSSLASGAQIPATPKAKDPHRFPRNAVGYRRGPRMGIWIVTVPKLFVAINSTAYGIASTANAGPMVLPQAMATLPDPDGTDPRGFSAKGTMYEYNDPVLGPGSDIVAASAPVSTGDRRQPSMAHPFTAPSVFLPMEAMADVGSFFKNNYLNDDDDGVDEDDLLSIYDFIDFGDSSSEDGNKAAGNDSTLTSPVTAEGPSPVQLKTPSPDATMASDNLMKHLDKHIVSAFRRGQSHHQTQPRPRHGNLAPNSYALKNKRQAAANAPMGPQRKRKMSGGLGHRPSLGGPAFKKRMIHHR